MLVPQITVKLRPESAALHGLTAGQVRQAVTTLISGRKVGEVYQEQHVHDVTVWSVPAVRADYTTLRELLIETPAGGHVRLADVADLAIVPTPNAIKREGASRRIDVTCNVSGRALGDVAREIEAAREQGQLCRKATIPKFSANGPSARPRKAASAGSRSRRSPGILVLLLADFQSPAPRPAHHAHTALRSHRRRDGRVVRRRRALARFARRLRHRARHRRAQRHPARQPLPASGKGRRPRLWS